MRQTGCGSVSLPGKDTSLATGRSAALDSLGHLPEELMKELESASLVR
jgi:hypothetical protein